MESGIGFRGNQCFLKIGNAPPLSYKVYHFSIVSCKQGSSLLPPDDPGAPSQPSPTTP